MMAVHLAHMSPQLGHLWTQLHGKEGPGQCVLQPAGVGAIWTAYVFMAQSLGLVRKLAIFLAETNLHLDQLYFF